jgi:hypothetical protein
MTQVKQSKWRERDYDGIIALARAHLWDNYIVPERLDFFCHDSDDEYRTIMFPPRNMEGLLHSVLLHAVLIKYFTGHFKSQDYEADLSLPDIFELLRRSLSFNYCTIKPSLQILGKEERIWLIRLVLKLYGIGPVR